MWRVDTAFNWWANDIIRFINNHGQGDPSECCGVSGWPAEVRDSLLSYSLSARSFALAHEWGLALGGWNCSASHICRQAPYEKVCTVLFSVCSQLTSSCKARGSRVRNSTFHHTHSSRSPHSSCKALLWLSWIKVECPGLKVSRTTKNPTAPIWVSFSKMNQTKCQSNFPLVTCLLLPYELTDK